MSTCQSMHKRYDCYVHVEYLGKFSAILEECTNTKIAIVGDFNAAVSTSFKTELLALCESQNLVISDYQLLGRLSEQFTFVSDAHSTTSWLDHFICSHDFRVGRWHLPAVFATGICHRYLPVNTGMDNTPKSGVYRHLLAFINISLISLQITLLTVLATYYIIHGHHSTIFAAYA